MTVPKSYEEAVDTLARDHLSVDETIKEVWSFDDPARQVVRVVEVSDAPELPPENGEAAAYPFGKSRDFPFRSEIVLLTRTDWARVEAGTLRLPPGWMLANRRRVGS